MVVNLRAIRGATQIASNDARAIGEGSKELLSAILKVNDLAIDDLVSVLLTSTADLNAAFPASALREIGFAGVPLLCAQEIDVPNALPRTIRVMLHVRSERSMADIEHVYLHGASVLRKDLAQ
jgi:chorismate mutase